MKNVAFAIISPSLLGAVIILVVGWLIIIIVVGWLGIWQRFKI